MTSFASDEGEQLTEVRGWAYTAARNKGATVFEAEDAAQETVLKVLQYWDRPGATAARLHGNWRSYVCRIAVNCLWGHVKENARERAARDNLAAELGAVDDELRVRPGTVRPTIDDTHNLEDGLAVKAILDEVDKLRAGNQQQVADLAWSQGFTTAEIAEALSTTKGNVRKHQVKARKVLLRRLRAAGWTEVERYLAIIEDEPSKPACQ